MSFEIFNVKLDHLSTDQLDTLLRGWVKGFNQKMIVTPNPEILLKARQNPYYRTSLQAADLSLPDGVGLRFAAAAQGNRMRFRHTGTDTVAHLARICDDYGKTMILFGGSSGSAQEAARALRAQHRDLDVVAIDPGKVERVGGSYLEQDIVDELDRHQPAVLAVALGAGKQEDFIREYLPRLPSVRVAIGIGGAFEMISGNLPRAPQWMRRTGLEWAWRLGLEPRRAGRIWSAAVRFPAAVAYDTLRQGRFLTACYRVTPEVFRQLIGK